MIRQKVNFTWELIIADDYSTDGTREIIIDYQRKYPDLIKLVLQNKNVGPAKNFIDLVSSPQSKYVAYLEGDDYWTDQTKLSFQYNFLENNPEYVLLGGYSNKIKEIEDYKIIHNHSLSSKSNYNFDFDTRYLITKNPLSSSTIFFRNGVVNEFPDVYRQGFGGDRRLYILLSLHGKCRYFNKSWGVYRIHSGGVTQKYEENNKIAGIEARLEVIKRWDKYLNYKYSYESELELRAYLKKLLKLYIKEIKIIKSIICVFKLFRVIRY